MASYGGQRGGARYPQKAPTEWFNEEDSNAFAAAIAPDAQETVFDTELDHPTTNEDYGPGGVEGLRLAVAGETGTANLIQAPTLYVLILKQGATVPTLNTPATAKQAEDRIWLQGKAEIVYGAVSGGTARGSWRYEAAPKTSRRFNKGDRLVCVAVNRDTAAWANPHVIGWSIDCTLKL